MGREAELIEAAREGNYPQVERILSTKPKKAGPFASLRRAQGGICSRDSRGYTALHYAALNGHKDVAQLLLSYEASCNSVDEAGSSPLHLAAWAGHGELVRVLLETGPSVPNVNLTNGDKETSLHCAAQYGHLEAVQLLLAAGADPNIKNSREETALDHAAQYGRRDTVTLLLETHPEMVGKYTAYGGMLYTHTPLHLASRNGHREVVAELLATGMDINVRTSRGTALHEAALCGKVEVVRTLLEHGVNTAARDSEARTVLDIMAELQTQRTREIAKIILGYSGGGAAELESPYENHHPGLGSSDPDSPVMCRPRAPSWHAREPRGARSVEELDKRISSFSTSSGVSDCTITTTSTLQGAKSESSFVSESEVTMTGTLTRDPEDTSLSSASSSASLSPGAEVVTPAPPRPASRVSQATLTATKPAPPQEKPKIAPKPALIRPGLKPVQIPNVDDKLGLRPRKPPRRNHSISPVRTAGWESEGCEDSASSCSKRPKPQKSVYSSKAGSKSFDELDDILSDKPRKQLSKRRGRRTMSTISGSDLQRAKERRDAAEAGAGCGLPARDCEAADCQRCVLNSLSNRTLAEDAGPSLAAARERYISQKQYKRKIRRESAGGGGGYGTLDTRIERRLLANGHGAAAGGGTKIVSKTTYKLKKFNSGAPGEAELDSAGEESHSSQHGLELMEIPLSPTHYHQPPTPEHSPPSAWEAESAIHAALSFLRSEHAPRRRTQATATEPWMLLPLDPAQWPPPPGAAQLRDAATSTRPETAARPDLPPPTGRALPALPWDAVGGGGLVTSSALSSDEDTSCSEAVPRPGAGQTGHPPDLDPGGCIYQTIGGDSGDSDSSAAPAPSTAPDPAPAILSPFNEQEEWSKISQIINSFGADIGKQTEAAAPAATAGTSTPHNSPVYDYPTLKRRERLAGTVAEWLSYISMQHYTTHLEGAGYDNINFLGGGVMTREDLLDIGITDPKDCAVLIDSLRDRANDFDFDANQEPKSTLVKMNVEDWLAKIKLEQYLDNFRDNLMTDMERIMGVWDEELVSILEIDRVGHRKRILLSVAGPGGLKKRCGKVDTIRRKSVDKTAKDRAKQQRGGGGSASSSPAREAGKKSSVSPETVSGSDSFPGTKSASSLDGCCSNTESEVSVSTVSDQRRNTSTSSTSDTSSDKPPTPSKTKRSSVESGTLTLGRRKKRAPAPPTPGQVSPQLRAKELHNILDTEPATSSAKVKASNTIERSGVRSKEKHSKHSKYSFSASFKANYHGNNLVKEFNGIETTREAIERVKSSKDIINRTGMPVTMSITEKDVRISIFEGEDCLHQHLITNICCIVYDTDNMCMFGYITADIENLQRFSHVFSAENKERASEILTAICKGYKENSKSQAASDKDTLKKSSSKGASKRQQSDVELRKVARQKYLFEGLFSYSQVSSGSDLKDHRASRSDQLVTRMRNFFQGSEGAGRSYSIGHKKLSSQAEARRKRGGSMDNLIDSIESSKEPGAAISQDTKKKCSSIKNLAFGSLKTKDDQKEVKITSV